MVTTVSLTSASVEQVCKYSQLHMSVKHDHAHERKAHIVSRLQQHQQPHKEGLALCHRVTLESVAHWCVPARTPTVHRCPKGKAVGGPTQAPRDDHPQHDKDRS